MNKHVKGMTGDTPTHISVPLEKYWEWMMDKHRAYQASWIDGHYLMDKKIVPTDQMLLGYMMEYLDEKEPGWHKRPAWTDCKTTAQRYAWMERKIGGMITK